MDTGIRTPLNAVYRYTGKTVSAEARKAWPMGVALETVAKEVGLQFPQGATGREIRQRVFPQVKRKFTSFISTPQEELHILDSCTIYGFLGRRS